MRRILWAIPVLAAVWAFPLDAQTGRTVEEVVRAREVAFAQTMAERDFDAFSSFLSPEAVFFNGQTPIRGAEAVRRAWAGYFEGPEAPFSWQPEVVVALEETRDLALSSGTVRNGDGDEVGRFNTIWRLGSDGVWRVVFDKGGE